MEKKTWSVLSLLLVCILIIGSSVSAVTIKTNISSKNHIQLDFKLTQKKSKMQNVDNENFDCFIVGRATETGFILPGPGGGSVILGFSFPRMFVNISISFGYKFWCEGAFIGKFPSDGWVWTKGSNGEITYRGENIWGKLGKKDYLKWIDFGVTHFDNYLLYIGVKGFTGYRIGGLLSCIFFGTAEQVNIIPYFPG
jgi:hypothetical protein